MKQNKECHLHTFMNQSLFYFQKEGVAVLVAALAALAALAAKMKRMILRWRRTKKKILRVPNLRFEIC